MALHITESGNDTIVKGLENFNLESILECGQCFRWEQNTLNDYTGIVNDKVVRIIQKDDEAIFYGCKKEDLIDLWNVYFDLGTNYGNIIKKISKNDPVMQIAVGYAPGIRILRQPLFETLISFIISSNNSIYNIKRVIAAISKMYGKKIIFNDMEFFTFPDPTSLAAAKASDVSLCKAGYRSQYIIDTAAAFAKNPLTVDALKRLGYFNAKKELMKYAGVGAKVADCTLLFSGTFMNAFPVDVWVKKIMEELYMGKDIPLKEISDYAYKKFGEFGGYAQQYLFYYARSNM